MTLLMARVLADNQHPAMAAYYLAFIAHLLDRCPYFHLTKYPFPVARSFVPV